jgi:adenylosuccinate synthase
MIKADIIVGLQHGDCGKGKVAHHLAKTQDYTHVIRYNGGCNAGHTIFHQGVKVVTHHIPAGVFFGIKSIIGPGCVLDVHKFFHEINVLSEVIGPSVRDMIKVANNVHIIKEEHLSEDSTDEKLGTTKSGNGPAYRDKYSRIGTRAQEIEALKPFLVDMYEELHNDDDVRVLFEGAQGFSLDVDWGDYPYVTSSHCTTAGALLNGVPPQSVENVWGIAKIYETYVGTKDFQPNDPVFNRIQQVGREFGATTGRTRQCNWLDWDNLEKAINVNGVTSLVFNKMDVLREIGIWGVRYHGEEKRFNSEDDMKRWIQSKVYANASFTRSAPVIYFSESPEHL